MAYFVAYYSVSNCRQKSEWFGIISMSLVKWTLFGTFILAATFFLLLMAYYPQSIDTVNLEEFRERTKHFGQHIFPRNFQPLQTSPIGFNRSLEELIGSNENNLFFIETNDNKSEFHPRALCAFESAAVHNPSLKVEF